MKRIVKASPDGLDLNVPPVLPDIHVKIQPVSGSGGSAAAGVFFTNLSVLSLAAQDITGFINNKQGIAGQVSEGSIRS